MPFMMHTLTAEQLLFLLLMLLQAWHFGLFLCTKAPVSTANGMNLSVLSAGPKLLGHHPQTGEEVLLRTGRYGFFLQVGTDKTASAVQAMPRASKLKASKKKPAKSVAKARMVSLK